MDAISQYLIIGGVIVIILVAIVLFRNNGIRMKSHHKIQAVGLIGLTLIALIALVSLSSINDSASLIAVVSAAVGAIGGFLSHKPTTPNKTLLAPIEDKIVKLGEQAKFTVAGISTSNYNLNYSMAFTPPLPEGEDANVNPTTGEFSWKPSEKIFTGEETDKEYTVRFTVTDGMGGTDFRDMKIRVLKA